MNIVCTGKGDFVEIQGTAEHTPFTLDQMSQMIELARKGTGELIEMQREVLGKV
jgi:ribonuclease PH